MTSVYLAEYAYCATGSTNQYFQITYGYNATGF